MGWLLGMPQIEPRREMMLKNNKKEIRGKGDFLLIE